jgi:predicted metal-dependent enzyme (double-stranded beta helix superfamily)
MTAAVYTLSEFVRECQAITDLRQEAERTIADIVGPLERIISRNDCLADLEPNGSADPERGFVIHRAKNLSILAVVWPEGSGAPVHNHNGWAMEGVISGVEVNRNFTRTDDGARPWVATLEETPSTEVRTGQTTVLAEPPSDIHAVSIPEGKTLAIHVYGVDIVSEWRYGFDLESGEVTPFHGRTAGLGGLRGS